MCSVWFTLLQQEMSKGGLEESTQVFFAKTFTYMYLTNEDKMHLSSAGFTRLFNNVVAFRDEFHLICRLLAVSVLLGYGFGADDCDSCCYLGHYPVTVSEDLSQVENLSVCS